MAGPALPNLTVQQLEYLVAVSESPTWAVAAERVGVTPSALSQGLAELERRLGLPLFERVGRRRILRPASGPVLRHAISTIAATSDLASWAARERTGSLGHVRLGMIDTAVTHHFSDVLKRHRQTMPDVSLQLTVAPSGELLDALERSDLDVVVCVEGPAVRQELIGEVVSNDPLVVVAPPGVDTASPASWGPWVSFPDHSHTRAVAERAILSRTARFEVVAVSNQPDVLLELTNLGIGWSTLPATLTRDIPSNRVVELVDRRLVLYRRRRATPSPATERLCRSLLDGAAPDQVS